MATTYELTTDKQVIIATNDNGGKTPYIIADLQGRLTSLNSELSNQQARFQSQVLDRLNAQITQIQTIITEADTLSN